MQFTTHNILLNNGQTTMGASEILLGNSKMWAAINKSVQLFIPDLNEHIGQMQVVDLGCLEGGYAVEFARLGFNTLGIEARKENIAKCNYVKEQTNLSNLKFTQADVRTLADYGKFDIAFCSGLLYHLHDPVHFLKILSDCTLKLLILNTHYAPEHDLRYSLGLINHYLIAPLQHRIKFFETRKNYQLSSISVNEGYRGRWYKEWQKKEKEETVEGLLKASYNNYRSFWLCKKDLVKALHEVGFHHVFEQFDFMGDIAPENMIDFHSRSLFVAIKE